MNSIVFYRMMAKVYDLLDVIYFRDYDHSPRKITNDRIRSRDKILDLCTGTATNAMNLAGQNPGTKVVGIDLSKDMLRVAKVKVKRSGLRNIRLYQIRFLEPKPYRLFIKKDMYEFFGKYGLSVEEFYHSDYTKVLVLKKTGSEL